MAKESYFLKRVLPSVGMTDKASYNLSETAIILGVSKTTLFRMIRQEKIKAVNSGPSGSRKVYRQEFIDYFQEYDFDGC
jgi:excisionase family DNA binding protein